jgi:hypothetical protein
MATFIITAAVIAIVGGLAAPLSVGLVALGSFLLGAGLTIAVYGK